MIFRPNLTTAPSTTRHPLSRQLPFVSTAPALALCLALATAPAVRAQDAAAAGNDQATKAAEQTGPSSGAGQTVTESRGSVTVRPGGEVYSTANLRVAIVGATETGGDVALARRGMAAAFAAVSALPGYTNIAPGDIARAMRTTTTKRDAVRPPDYAVLRQRLKADRTLSVTLRPGDATGESAAYSAVVELIDTTSGGLVGRGEGAFTATAGGADIATAPLNTNGANSVTPSANLARDVRVSPNASVAERAVDGAVARAVFDLNRPIQVRGVVLNKIARSGVKGAPLFTRISLGELSGARVGTPIEYLSPQGERIGFGTIVDLAPGESLATVAPEAAYGNLHMNCEVRSLDNPPLARAGSPVYSNDEREWARFERSFGLALGIAGAAYLAFK